MTASLLLNDLLVWCFQIALVTVCAALVPAVVRIKTPAARLAYWQLTLAAFLALPLLCPWQNEVVSAPISSSSSGWIKVAHHQSPGQSMLFSTTEILFWIVLGGVFVRIAFIAIGLLRLRKYRRHASPLDPTPAWCNEAAILVSPEIGSPVTFGFFRPVILLPENFLDWNKTAADAVLCHEILHVRRRDWLLTMAEEFVRALFWFHPAIWWTVGEIQLAREQTVDRAAIDMLNSRDQYVDALLSIAGAASTLDVAPAPLFLRKRHLKQRVVSILKEVRMSQTKTLSTLAAGLGLLAASCWFIAGALPLEGGPQSMTDAPGVSVDTNGARVMHRSRVNYPGAAIAHNVAGTVVAQVRTDADGNVIDANIISGPDELRRPVLESVLGWHFAKNSSGTTHQVTVAFEVPKAASGTAGSVSGGIPSGVTGGIIGALPATASPVPAPGIANRAGAAIPSMEPPVVKEIRVTGLQDEDRDSLLAQLPVHVGDALTPEQFTKTLTAVRAFDEHLRMFTMGTSGSETTLVISAPEAATPVPALAGFQSRSSAAGPFPEPPLAPGTPVPAGTIRVGGAVQANNLLTQVRPAYPPLAKQARVQGVVRFEALIAKDGSIQNLALISGPPLLVQSAMEAVQLWKYKPTLLNGQPIQVLTTIDVNYTLSE
ncbi:MAG TPA: TonB family protein [Bryobacteraceae bacterium]|nr:TonB family protein [Bryobacteraceae bacterium]